MNVTKGRLIQIGASFYEQALLRAYAAQNLPETEARVLLEEALEIKVAEAFSVSRALQHRVGDPLPQLKGVAAVATTNFQKWISNSKFDSEFAYPEYRFINEIGQIYREIPLASDNEQSGHFYNVEFTASNGNSVKTLIPFFGWRVTEQEFNELNKRGNIIHPKNNYTEVLMKDVLQFSKPNRIQAF